MCGLYRIHRKRRRDNRFIQSGYRRGSDAPGLGIRIYPLQGEVPLSGGASEYSEKVPQGADSSRLDRPGLAVLGKIRMERDAFRRGALSGSGTDGQGPSRYGHEADDLGMVKDRPVFRGRKGGTGEGIVHSGHHMDRLLRRGCIVFLLEQFPQQASQAIQHRRMVAGRD